MQQNIIIRNYRDSDYENVKFNLQEGALFDPIKDTKENLKIKNKRNPGSIIVATINKKVVGNIFIVEDGWVAYLFRLAVYTNCRKGRRWSIIDKGSRKKIKKERR